MKLAIPLGLWLEARPAPDFALAVLRPFEASAAIPQSCATKSG